MAAGSSFVRRGLLYSSPFLVHYSIIRLTWLSFLDSNGELCRQRTLSPFRTNFLKSCDSSDTLNLYHLLIVDHPSSQYSQLHTDTFGWYLLTRSTPEKMSLPSEARFRTYFPGETFTIGKQPFVDT